MGELDSGLELLEETSRNRKWSIKTTTPKKEPFQQAVTRKLDQFVYRNDTHNIKRHCMVHFHSCILDTKVKSPATTTDSEDDQLLAVSFRLFQYTGHLPFYHPVVRK